MYFILICIAIGLINWFIIIPLLEKKEMQKFLDTMKSVWNTILSFLAGVFIIYAYIATIMLTANLLAEYLKFEQTGILAFILVSALAYLAYKKFEE